MRLTGMLGEGLQTRSGGTVAIVLFLQLVWEWGGIERVLGDRASGRDNGLHVVSGELVLMPEQAHGPEGRCYCH